MDNWTKAGIIIVALFFVASLTLLLYGLATDCPNTAGYVKCEFGAAWG